MQPDWTAFATAIGEFRESAGQMCQFKLPDGELTYPPGTVLDPATGKPYDPTIEAENEGETQTVEVNALVVRGAANSTHARDAVQSEALGLIQVDEAVFVVSFADWKSHGLDHATEVRGLGSDTGWFAITETTFDVAGGAGESDRALIRGKMTVAP